MIKKLQNRLDAVLDGIENQPQNSQTPGKDDTIMKMRLNSIDNRLRVVEEQIILPKEVSNIELQFPVVIKELERRIDNLQNLVTINLSAKQVPEKIWTQSNIPKKNPPFVVNPTLSKKSPPKPLSPQEKSTASPRPEEIAPDPVLEPIVKEDIEILPEIDLSKPVDGMRKVKIEFDEGSGRGKKFITGNSSNRSSFVEKLVEENPVVTKIEVFENHSYTTEMQSSVRVVTEIEWLKSVVGQHNEAIRKLQGVQRTEQENTETISENLLRMNGTHNQRMAQLAQQNMLMREDHEQTKRIIIEQLSNIKQKLVVLSHSAPSKQIVLTIDSPSLVFTATVSPSTSHPITPTKKDPLPPLSFPMEPDFESSGSEYVSAKEPSSLESLRERIEPEKPKFVQAPIHERNRSFIKPKIFSITTTVDIPPVLTKLEPKEEKRKKTNRVNIQKTEKEEELQKLATRRSNAEANIQYLSTQEYERPEKDERAPIKQIFLRNEVILKRPRTSGMDQSIGLQGDISAEAIEAKVSKAARMTVNHMVESVRREFDQRIDEVRNTSIKLMSEMETKVDRVFVERMFDKFRLILQNFKDHMDGIECSFLNWVTREELEIVLQEFKAILLSNGPEGAAVKTSKYDCLLCGKPRKHLAGMITTKV